MSFTINVKGKDLEIKFNYRLMFKVNKEMSSLDDQGRRQENGAGQLFLDIVERKDSAVHNLIRIAYGSKKITDDEILDAVGDYAEEHGYDEMFDDIEGELLDSGFFLPKIKKTIEDMKFGKELLSDSEKEEQKTQVKAIDAMLNKLQKRISSHNVPDMD